jgi:hypothetical protein
MRVYYAISAEVVQTDDVAVCELTVSTQNETYVFTDHSKRHVHDEPDQRVGRDVALGKALAQTAWAFLEDHV